MNLLVVVADPSMQQTILRALSLPGVFIDLAQKLETAIGYMRRNTYAVIILDISDTGVDGAVMIRDLERMNSGANILVVCNESQVSDPAGVPTLGVYDYMLAPIEASDLATRTFTLAGGVHAGKSAQVVLGGVVINRKMYAVRTYQDEEIHFTPSEYRIIEYLARHSGKVFSRTSLEKYLYQGKSGRPSNVVQVLISNINRKLVNSGVDIIVKSKRGFGYYIESGESISS